MSRLRPGRLSRSRSASRYFASTSCTSLSNSLTCKPVIARKTLGYLLKYRYRSIMPLSLPKPYPLLQRLSIRFHDLRHDWAHRARVAGWLLEEIAVYLGHQTKDGMPTIMT